MFSIAQRGLSCLLRICCVCRVLSSDRDAGYEHGQSAYSEFGTGRGGYDRSMHSSLVCRSRSGFVGLTAVSLLTDIIRGRLDKLISDGVRL